MMQGKKLKKTNISNEELRALLDRVIGFVHDCDNKTSIMVTFVGIFITFILSVGILKLIFSNLLTIICSINISLIVISVLFIIGVIFTVIGLIFFVSSLYAKIDATKKDLKIFFRDIALNKSVDIYEKKLLTISNTEYRKELANQIYINASICTKKYLKYNKGLFFSCIGIAFVLICVIFIK